MTSTLLSSSMQMATEVLVALDTPFSKRLLSLAVEGKWGELLRSEVSPGCYSSPSAYFLDAQALGLFKKFEALPTPRGDREKACIAKWWEGERSCYKSNERLSRYLEENSQFSDHTGPLSPILGLARKKIFSWLGAAPPELCLGRHGPGATFNDRGTKATVVHKFDNRQPALTRDAVWFLPQLLDCTWGRHIASHGELSFVRGNRFTTVPKTALVDRAIAVEPAINVFFQLGLGRALKGRLRSATGWNLRQAAPIHREMARRASIDRSFATIDLSNASDTVSRVLVKLLLPPRWYSQLDDLRSKRTFIEGHWVMLEKFSSMGNGFTFELESIIFAALCCAAAENMGGSLTLGSDLFVFGDDIILPECFHREVVAVLGYCGFSVNVQKTFSGDSPFRESCGADFMSGMDVRPVFFKKPLDNPSRIFSTHNSLLLLEDKLNKLGEYRDLSPVRRRLLAMLPRHLRRLKGPPGLGDVVLHPEPLEDLDRYCVSRFWIKYYRALLPGDLLVHKFSRFHPDAVLACALYGTGGSDHDGLVPRNPILSYRVGLVAAP